MNDHIEHAKVSNNEVTVCKRWLQTTRQFYLYSWLCMMSLREDTRNVVTTLAESTVTSLNRCSNSLFMRDSQSEESWLEPREVAALHIVKGMLPLQYLLDV